MSAGLVTASLELYIYIYMIGPDFGLGVGVNMTWTPPPASRLLVLSSEQPPRRSHRDALWEKGTAEQPRGPPPPLPPSRVGPSFSIFTQRSEREREKQLVMRARLTLFHGDGGDPIGRVKKRQAFERFSKLKTKAEAFFAYGTLQCGIRGRRV